MGSAFIREQKRYSRKELMDCFNLTSEEIISFIKKLKAYGVLKVVLKTSLQKDLTDLTDGGIEIIDFENQEDDVDDYYYIFTFVGVLTVGKIVIKCYPKYLITKNNPLNEMKQILKVLNLYNSKEQIIKLFNGESEQTGFNLLAVILYLLKDYNEYGLYKNQIDVIETNGNGEILWENTINESFAIIKNNRPIYTELRTINTINDDMDYFQRLHQFVITDCSKKLENANLLELFEIESTDLSEEELSDFGDVDYILYRLQCELNVQYVTRKQLLLKTLYSYIAHSKALKDNFGISMYGTNSFNLVWEKACSEVFDNQIKVKIRNIKLPMELHEDYIEHKDKTLLEIIEKPIWRYLDQEGKTHDNEANQTLKPDLISVYEKESGMCFGIFDAKYYKIFLNEKIVREQPGVGDVTKQYLYQLAFNPFIHKHGFKSVTNAFLMPTEEEHAILVGEVEMKMLEGLSEPKLRNILVVKIPANKIFNYYLNSRKLDIHKEHPFL